MWHRGGQEYKKIISQCGETDGTKTNWIFLHFFFFCKRKTLEKTPNI